MLQESFAWLPSTGFPTADPNVTLTFPVVVTALAASSHTAQASAAPPTVVQILTQSDLHFWCSTMLHLYAEESGGESTPAFAILSSGSPV